jgi:glycosyltransferase involved in cell wall biosynthesis
MRIAFFTPLPPLRTALADHSAGLLPYLGQGADLDLFIDEGYHPASQNVVEQFKIYSYKEFYRRAGDYDLTVYVMGNNAHFHGYIYNLMRDYPGVVILHDTDLQQYFFVRALKHGHWADYLAELENSYGRVAGRRIAAMALAEQIDRVQGVYPLVEPVISWSLGAIVYNEFAYHDLLIRCPQARVRQLKYHFYLPQGFPAPVDTQALRERWGLDGFFVIGTFGLFHQEKRLDVCLRAFKRFQQTRPDARYLLVGNHDSNYDLPGLIRSLELEDSVILTGWLEALEFSQHLCVPDIAIHLRYPHIGGTLYTPLRLLGLGRPTILSEIEPLAEFPEGCCVKIPPDDYEEDTLVEILKYLADQPDFRFQMEENAQQFIQRHYNIAQIAHEHLDFFEQVVNSQANPIGESASNSHDNLLIRESATILAKWDVNEDEEALLAPIAKAIASLGPNI